MPAHADPWVELADLVETREMLLSIILLEAGRITQTKKPGGFAHCLFLCIHMMECERYV